MDDLYTGANSGSFGNSIEQEALKRAKEQKLNNKSKLQPAYEVIKETINTELEWVKNVESFIVDDFNKEEVKEELIARQRYITFLNQLDTKMQNVLRDKK